MDIDDCNDDENSPPSQSRLPATSLATGVETGTGARTRACHGVDSQGPATQVKEKDAREPAMDSRKGGWTRSIPHDRTARANLVRRLHSSYISVMRVNVTV